MLTTRAGQRVYPVLAGDMCTCAYIARIPTLALARVRGGACSSRAIRRHRRSPPRVRSGRSRRRATREQTADEQVKQALNRLAFGARPGDAERVRAMGVDRWIALQLSPQKIDDRATERFVARFPVLAMSPAELLADYPQRSTADS